jgi:hypothetical protein
MTTHFCVLPIPLPRRCRVAGSQGKTTMRLYYSRPQEAPNYVISSQEMPPF